MKELWRLCGDPAFPLDFSGRAWHNFSANCGRINSVVFVFSEIESCFLVLTMVNFSRRLKQKGKRNEALRRIHHQVGRHQREIRPLLPSERLRLLPSRRHERSFWRENGSVRKSREAFWNHGCRVRREARRIWSRVQSVLRRQKNRCGSHGLQPLKNKRQTPRGVFLLPSIISSEDSAGVRIIEGRGSVLLHGVRGGVFGRTSKCLPRLTFATSKKFSMEKSSLHNRSYIFFISDKKIFDKDIASML